MGLDILQQQMSKTLRCKTTRLFVKLTREVYGTSRQANTFALLHCKTLRRFAKLTRAAYGPCKHANTFARLHRKPLDCLQN